MTKTDTTTIASDPLEELIAAYNDGKLSNEELIEKAIPWLEERRKSEIRYHMARLAESDPERYHISSPHQHQLWTDAVATYDAELTVKLANRPALRDQLESSQLDLLFRIAAQQS